MPCLLSRLILLRFELLLVAVIGLVAQSGWARVSDGVVAAEDCGVMLTPATPTIKVQQRPISIIEEQIQKVMRIGERRNFNEEPFVQSLVQGITTRQESFQYQEGEVAYFRQKPGLFFRGSATQRGTVLTVRVFSLSAFQLPVFSLAMLRSIRANVGLTYSKAVYGIVRGVVESAKLDPKLEFVRIEADSVVNAFLTEYLREMGFREIEPYQFRLSLPISVVRNLAEG